jgi:hypothetical protein
MKHDYTERHLVEEPALALLRELGWATVCAAYLRRGGVAQSRREGHSRNHE